MNHKADTLGRLKEAIHSTRNPMGVILAQVASIQMSLKEMDAVEQSVLDEFEAIVNAVKNVASGLSKVEEEIHFFEKQS